MSRHGEYRSRVGYVGRKYRVRQNSSNTDFLSFCIPIHVSKRQRRSLNSPNLLRVNSRRRPVFGLPEWSKETRFKTFGTPFR